MRIEPEDLAPTDRYRWMISSIVPRPIAFVSTLSADGVPNLAPFSYFNGVAAVPPLLSIVVGPKRGGVLKDTRRNIEETRELVVNVVTEDLAEPMVHTSGDWPSEESEFELTGLTPVPSERVKPPRVEESPLAMECRLLEIVPVGSPPSGIVLAEIVLFHAKEEILTDGLPDPRKLRPVGRLGGDLYTRLGELLELPRPKL